MQPPPSVGPLSAETVRPARTLAIARAVAVAVVLAVTVGVGVALAPRVLAGLGFIAPTPAVVLAVSGSPGSGCDRVTATVRPVGGRSAQVTWCRAGGDPAVHRGDTIDVWSVPGWDPVRADGRTAETILALLLLALALVSAWGTLVSTRQALAVRSLTRRRVDAPALRGRIDRLTLQRGVFKKDGRARMRVALDDARLQPLPIAFAHGLDRTWLGATVDVRAAGRTLRGRARGPYIVTRSDGGSTMLIGLGRAYRARHGDRRAGDGI